MNDGRRFDSSDTVPIDQEELARALAESTIPPPFDDEEPDTGLETPLAKASSRPPKDNTMTWSFSPRTDEPVLLRWHRIFEELLSEGPIGMAVQPAVAQSAEEARRFLEAARARLADFLDVVGKEGDPVAIIAGKPVSHIESWRTNCAMTQHAAMVWCKREMRPDVNAEPIQGGTNSYLELARGDSRWVENDGNARPVGPAIFYVTPSARLMFEHVGAFGAPIDADAGHWTTYEGGGGDGTRIGKSDRTLSKLDSYGRRIAGWWEIHDLLPASPESAPELTGPPDDTLPSQAIPSERPTEPEVA